MSGKVYAVSAAWKKRALVDEAGRSYPPKHRLEKTTEYSVPVSRDLEDAELKRSADWRIQQ
jgi:predicted nicotinamide N-methyase